MLAHFKTRCGCTREMELIAVNPWPEYRIPLQTRQPLFAEPSVFRHDEPSMDIRTFRLVDYRPLMNMAFYEEV